MTFVIDASAMMPWVFDDEDDPVSAEAARRAANEDMAVPALWWFELRNALIVGERRRRITPDDTQLFIRRLSGLAVAIDRAPDENLLFGLARQHRLTAYDAAYLELAKRTSASLATLDGALARAAQNEGVSLVVGQH